MVNTCFSSFNFPPAFLKTYEFIFEVNLLPKFTYFFRYKLHCGLFRLIISARGNGKQIYACQSVVFILLKVFLSIIFDSLEGILS